MGTALDFEDLALIDAVETGMGTAGPVSWVPADIVPTDRQQAFLDATEFDVLYGGAAGGGKTIAMLMAALQYVDVPGYSALLLRESFPELSQEGGLMDIAMDWLATTPAVWNDRDHRWTFPSGATLQFGYVRNLKDARRYWGGEYQFVGADELTNLMWRAIVKIRSRLRKRKGGALDAVPLRFRGATNPGGQSHVEVANHYGIRENGTQDKRKAWNEARGELRRFIPSKLADNPHMGEEYRLVLREQDSTTRAQLEDGRWVQDVTGLVLPLGIANFVDAAPSDGMVIGVGIDLGSSEDKKTTAISVVGWHPGIKDLVWVLHVEKTTDMTAGEMTARLEDLQTTFGRFSFFVMDEGALGKKHSKEMRRRYAVPIMPAEKESKRGFCRLLWDAAQDGDFLLVRGAADVLHEETKSLRWAENGRDMVGINHAFDATLYAWREARAFAVRGDREPPPDLGTEAFDQYQARQLKQRVLKLAGRKQREWWKR